MSQASASVLEVESGILAASSDAATVVSPRPNLLEPFPDFAAREAADARAPAAIFDLLVAPAGNRATPYLIAKRAIDLMGAGALLLLLSPIMLGTWLVLLWTTRGRPIFVQERVGFLGKPFRMYKFRTMVLDAAARQKAVANHQNGPVFKNFRDPRVTRVGRVLRSLSIDETPQLVNVLLGQMSLVGPRPALEGEVRQYEPWQRQRLAVKPGLTCLWQVSGRSEIGFEQWMHMDAWYVHHQGIWTDLTLLVRTPLSVLSRRGAY